MSKKAFHKSWLNSAAWTHCIAIVNLILFYRAEDMISDNNIAARLLFLTVAVVAASVIVGEIRLMLSGKKKQILAAIPLVILSLIIGGYSLLAAALLAL